MAKGQSARDYLLARGMWSAFVARPFGGPPDPGAKCAAILVSAVAGSRFAPDPDQVLADRREAFVRGLATLRELTEGPIHLCLDGATEVGRPEVPDLRLHRHRAGRFWRSASAQVARVCPASPARQVWTIGYQDVIAIGHLMETGRYDSVRRIALRPDGAGVAEMRTVPLGCDLWHMLGVARQQARRVPKSGTALSGRVSDFLGRYHLEAGLEAAPGEAARRFARPLIPLTSLGGVLPVALPVVPLMRSLIAGDAEASARLGCLQLLEEDVAPLASLCTSGTDYPERLRGVLDVLRRDLA
jgi:Na+-transporting NADH:ubiquinone oxidoreductase subunit A